MADMLFPVPGRKSIIGQWYYEQPDGSKGPLGPAITRSCASSEAEPKALTGTPILPAPLLSSSPPSSLGAAPAPLLCELGVLEKMVAGLSYDDLLALRLVIEKNLQAQFVRRAASLSVTE
jgi:hypothetical protein